MSATRAGRIARHPVAAVQRLGKRLARDPGLPAGRIADTRRLLRSALGATSRVLVVGQPAAVRQALPGAALDVAGTDPNRAEVTVVSAALDHGSLPRRWGCVVVTEPGPRHEHLSAAAGACLPGGLVAVVTDGSTGPPRVPGARVERTVRTRRVRLTLARVAS